MRLHQSTVAIDVEVTQSALAAAAFNECLAVIDPEAFRLLLRQRFVADIERPIAIFGQS